jgi:hypothetical protein
VLDSYARDSYPRNAGLQDIDVPSRRKSALCCGLVGRPSFLGPTNTKMASKEGFDLLATYQEGCPQFESIASPL